MTLQVESCTIKAEVAAVQSLHAASVACNLSKPVPLLHLLLNMQHTALAIMACL